MCIKCLATQDLTIPGVIFLLVEIITRSPAAHNTQIPTGCRKKRNIYVSKSEFSTIIGTMGYTCLYCGVPIMLKYFVANYNRSTGRKHFRH